MAKVSPVPVSESETREPKPNSKTPSNETADKESMDVDAAGEESEEEYEIEAILDAKRGSFPGGRMGYFVKWKNYPESENSWVDEQDAGNAQDLIDAFWKRTKKPRKSVDAKTPKQPRKSAVPDEVTDPSTKKRSRKSEAGTGENSPTKEARATKKAKNSGKAESSELDEEVPIIVDMSKYDSLPSWESIIKTIDTVEREPDDTLIVYFTLKSGERVRQLSEVCATRCPQKLIKFYESNLRWKSAENEGEA